MIPLMEDFSFERLHERGGLISTYLNDYTLENQAAAFLFNSIKDALILCPDKVAVVSLEDGFYLQRKLFEYLTSAGLPSERVVFIQNHQEVRVIPKERISGIFIFNPLFFEDLRPLDDAPLTMRARILSRFCTTYNELPKFITQVVRPQHEIQLGRTLQFAQPSQSQSMISSAILYLTKGEAAGEVKVNVRKNRYGNPNKILRYRVIDFQIALDPSQFKEESSHPFFDLALGNFFTRDLSLPEEALVPPGLKTISEVFSFFRASKSIKKVITEHCIKKTRYEAEGFTWIDFRYGVLYFYIIMKQLYGKKFDPNLFISAVDLYSGCPFAAVEHFEELRFLSQHLSQEKMYRWLNPEDDGLRDLLIIMKKLKDNTIPFTIPAKVPSLSKLHDRLSEHLAIHSPENLRVVGIQKDKVHWNETMHEIEVEGRKETLRVVVPLKGIDFKLTGKEAGLCVQNEWFWDSLEKNKRNLIFLYEEKEFKYCVELSTKRLITQAKGLRNRSLSEEVIGEIAALVESLP